MRSDALENIVTMLRAQAAERGGAPMTLGEWREAYDGLGALLPAAEGVAVEEVDAGGVRAERIGSGDGPVVSTSTAAATASDRWTATGPC